MIYKVRIATYATSSSCVTCRSTSVDTAYTAVARVHPIKPFDDKRVRQALRYAIDSEADSQGGPSRARARPASIIMSRRRILNTWMSAT